MDSKYYKAMVKIMTDFNAVIPEGFHITWRLIILAMEASQTLSILCVF